MRAQVLEVLREIGLGRIIRDPDRGEPVGLFGRPMLESEVARLCEENVDDDPLGWSEENLLDALLTLVVAAVGADKLHLSSRHPDIEDARVGGVREVEAHDFPACRFER